MRATVLRKAHFNAAHRLDNPKWDIAKNQATFGACNNPNYHGHNYELWVEVEGEIDPETGYVFDMKILKDLIDEHVTEPFDHKNLNMDVPAFEHVNPTAENIAVEIHTRLRNQIDPHLELSITLYETERNAVKYRG